MEKDKVSGIYYPSKSPLSKTTAVVFGGNIGFGYGETKQFGRDHKLLCIFETEGCPQSEEDLKKNYNVNKPQVHLVFKSEDSVNALIAALELLKENFFNCNKSIWKNPLEELPEDGQEVIFRDCDNTDNYGYFSKDDNVFWSYDGSGGWKSHDVEAWYPIPECDVS